MAIPKIELSGFLPAGIHDCTLAEIRERFGTFQGSDQRPKLFARLEEFLSEARRSAIVRSVVVNGSFVTAAAMPNDIDLIVVVSRDHDFSTDLTPTEYNILSKQRVHRRFGFDLLVAREDSPEYARWIEFFHQVRLEPGRQKGILKVVI